MASRVAVVRLYGGEDFPPMCVFVRAHEELKAAGAGNEVSGVAITGGTAPETGASKKG